MSMCHGMNVRWEMVMRLCLSSIQYPLSLIVTFSLSWVWFQYLKTEWKLFCVYSLNKLLPSRLSLQGVICSASGGKKNRWDRLVGRWHWMHFMAYLREWQWAKLLLRNTELYTWNLYNYIKLCHPNKFNKKVKNREEKEISTLPEDIRT